MIKRIIIKNKSYFVKRYFIRLISSILQGLQASFYRFYRIYSTGFTGFILQGLQFLFYNLQFTVFFSLSQMQFELGSSIIYITLFTTILFLFLSMKN